MTKVTQRGVISRFLLGLPMGVPRTNAGPFYKGTKITHPSGKASARHYRSHAHRALLRWAVLATLAAIFIAWSMWPGPTTVVLIMEGIAAVSWVSVRGILRARSFRHTREKVTPLRRVLDASPHVPTDYTITVPPGAATNPDVKTIVAFPEHFTAEPESRIAIERMVRDKLGFSDVTAVWHLAGRRPHLAMAPAPEPPGKLLWDDALPLIKAASPSAPVLGVTTRGKVVVIDLDSVSPHVLVSAGTGAGKSVIVRGLTSQLMRNGAHVIVLDAKRHSHRWIDGLDRVVYSRSTAEIHDALIAAAEEGERRNVIVQEHGDDACAHLPRIVIVCEEMNATINRLQRYWNEIRANSDPKPSPAVHALGEVLFMGRAVRMNVIAVAQMMTARALGGPEARENFAVRILARSSANTWKMLAPEISPTPRSSRHPGRVHMCLAGRATLTQVVFPTDDQARTWASGTVPVLTSVESRIERENVLEPGTLGRHKDHLPHNVPVEKRHLSLVGQAETPGRTELGQDKTVKITLSEAAHKYSINIDVLRRASTRDARFPDPFEPEPGAPFRYDDDEIAAWAANRSARASRRTGRTGA